MFQFPSNGKAYPKEQLRQKQKGSGIMVSIPFKRESGSKVVAALELHLALSFQFPSNGKADPKSLKTTGIRLFLTSQFQFPSNGKADPKKVRSTHISPLQRVSIPFKRESGSKAIHIESALYEIDVSIPFKRESGSKETLF